MVERKKNESGRRETEKGNKNDFWEICLAPFMFLQRHVSFFGGGGGATWFETFGYLGVSVKRGPDTCGWRMRMADADGKTRMEKCGWNKMRITKKVRRKKREMRMAKKKINK